MGMQHLLITIHYTSYLVQSFPSLKLKFVSSKEIEVTTHSLKPTDSHEYDEISIQILKVSSLYISSPLTYLCNWMLSSGIFPSRLKFSEIKPLFKKGDKSSISYYRPVSILTSFSKIIEKIICTRIIEHVNYNQILAEEQFGFKNKYSTDSATYKLLNDILTSLNSKLRVEDFFAIFKKLLIVSTMIFCC